MKRYIVSSEGSFNSKLVSAITQVILSCLDMGDSLSDVVEGLADMGGIDLPDEYDEDEALQYVLKKLVAQHSAAIPDFIIYNFIDNAETLLFEISTDTPSGKDSPLYKAIKTIYDYMGNFPNGDSVKSEIEENIFNSALIEGNAAEVGYDIGLHYWRFIQSEEYGVRSNTASAVGVSAGCREAVGGKYKYAFGQDIGSYYYEDLREQNPGMPAYTGFMVKFYNEGQAVCADVFNIYTVPTKTSGAITWDIGDHVLYTFTFTDFSDSGIDTASKEIAKWYDDHVQDAIDFALSCVK